MFPFYFRWNTREPLRKRRKSKDSSGADNERILFFWNLCTGQFVTGGLHESRNEVTILANLTITAKKLAILSVPYFNVYERAARFFSKY
jgi:hypothetical protein